MRRILEYIRARIDGADAGKMAHYLIRWVSTRNEPGPWSEVHSATIGGVSAIRRLP